MPYENEYKNQLDIPEGSSIRGFQYLSLQGGGMKGIGHCGAIAALEEQGVLGQLTEVAGTSAGGLAATLIAIGCSAAEIQQELGSVDFRAFQDKAEPGVIESTGLLGLSPLVEVEEIVKLAFGVDLGLWEGDALNYWLSNLVARKTGNPNLTFRDLALLTEVSGSPFKKLTLTGSNLTTKQLEYYNSVKTPDMPIVKAARISASVPGAYKPVIDIENGQKMVRVDGGLLENLPSIFHKGQDTNPKAFALSFESSAKQEIETGLDLGKAVLKTVLSIKDIQEKFGPNIAYIDTKGMGTLEFDASEEKRKALSDSGRTAVENAFQRILQNENSLGRQPVFQGVPSKELTEEALINLCDQKRSELKRIQLEFSAKFKQFKLARAALRLNKNILLSEILKNNSQNAFQEQLLELNEFERRILVSLLNQDETQAFKCRYERALFLDVIIKEQESSANKPLYHFFKNIKEDIKDPSFLTPVTQQELEEYCKKDIESCSGYIRQCSAELRGSRAKIVHYEQSFRSFKDRKDKAVGYERLLKLRAELNAKVYRKTVLLTKINHYLISKSQRFSGIISFFLKAIALLAFVCRLPLAIPAVVVAKIVGHCSSDPKTVAVMACLVDSFRCTDLEFEKRWRKIRDITARCVKKITENYSRVFDAKDSFIQSAKESDEEYRQRLEKMEAELDKKLLPQPSRFANTANFELFRKNIKRRVAELMAKQFPLSPAAALAESKERKEKQEGDASTNALLLFSKERNKSSKRIALPDKGPPYKGPSI